MKTRKTTKPAKIALDWRRHHKPDGTWDIDSMTHEELDQLAAEADQIRPGESRPLNAKERAKFEAWQKRSLAAEAKRKKPEKLQLLFPADLVTRLDSLAKTKHTTRGELIQQIVEQAIHQAVA